MRICLRDIEISLQEAIELRAGVVKKVESLLHASGAVSELLITRRILDVRRNRPRYLYVVECEVPETLVTRAIDKKLAATTGNARSTGSDFHDLTTVPLPSWWVRAPPVSFVHSTLRRQDSSRELSNGEKTSKDEAETFPGFTAKAP